MSDIFYSAIGFVGASLILFGFYRTSIGRWKSKSFWYEMDNFVGAILVTIYQFHTQAYITMVLNVIWAVVALRGLSSFADRYQKNLQKHRSKRRQG